MSKKRTLFVTLLVVAMIMGIAIGVSSTFTAPSGAVANAEVAIWDGSVDASWHSFDTNEFVLTNAAQVAGISQILAAGYPFSSVTIKLGADIDLDGRVWTPINGFDGTFDGDGHTISNGTIAGGQCVAFFGEAGPNLTLQNVNFDNIATTSSDSYAAIALAYSNTSNVKISNVNVTNSTLSSYNYAAIIMGSTHNNAVLIENCNVENCAVIATASNKYFSAILAQSQLNSDNTIIRNCNVFDTTITTISDTWIKYTGTLFAGANSGSTVFGPVTISNCSTNMFSSKKVVEGETTETFYYKIVGNEGIPCSTLENVRCGLDYLYLDGGANVASLLKQDSAVASHSFVEKPSTIEMKFSRDTTDLAITVNDVTLADTDYTFVGNVLTLTTNPAVQNVIDISAKIGTQTVEYSISTGLSIHALDYLKLDDVDCTNDLVLDGTTSSADYTNAVDNVEIMYNSTPSEIVVTVNGAAITPTIDGNKVSFALTEDFNNISVAATVDGVSRTIQLNTAIPTISATAVSTTGLLSSEDMFFLYEAGSDITLQVAVPEGYTATASLGDTPITMDNGVLALGNTLVGVNTYTVSLNRNGATTSKDLSVYSVSSTTQSNVYAITTDTTYPWHTDATDPNTFISGNQGEKSSSSDIYLLYFNAPTIAFDYSVSSEANWDKLFVAINDEVLLTVSGTDGGSFSYATATPELTIVKVYYTKDTSGNTGSDSAQITLVAPPAAFVSLTINYDATQGTVVNTANHANTVFDSGVEYTLPFGTEIELSVVGKYGVDSTLFAGQKTATVFHSVVDNATSTALVSSMYYGRNRLSIAQDSVYNVLFQEALLYTQELELEQTINEVAYPSTTLADGAKIPLVFSNVNHMAIYVPALNVGEECFITLNGVQNTSALIADKGNYFYIIDNCSADTDIVFTYEVTTESNYYIPASLSMSFVVGMGSETIDDLLILDSSKEYVSLVNTSAYPYEFNSPLSASDRPAFSSTNMAVGSSVSWVAFDVNHAGVLQFEWMASTEKNYDYVVYSVGTEITTDNIATCAFVGGSKDLSSGEAAWSTVQIPVELGEAASKRVYFGYYKDSSANTNLDIAAIANVQLFFGEKTVNFNKSVSAVEGVDNGTVTATRGTDNIVSGSSISTGATITFTATPAEGYDFFLWVDGEGNVASYNKTFTISLLNDCSYTAIMEASGLYKARIGTTFFTSLSTALATAVDGDMVIMVGNVTIDTDAIVPTGVTLLIPFSADDLVGTSVLKTTAQQSLGTSRVAWTDEAKYLFNTVTVNEGGSLTIEGTVILGGVQHYPDQSAQGHTSGAYSQIVNNGTITVNGTFDNYGRILGSGTLVVNGTLKTPFMVNNYSGGTNTEAHYNAGYFPFVQFATVNIACNQTVNYGAKVYGSTSLYFWSSVTTQDVVLLDMIENRGSEGSLLWMSAGSSVDISYDGAKAVKQAVGNINLTDSGVCTLTIHGNVTAGEFFLQSYGSGDKVLSVPYTYNITVADDGILTIAAGTQYMVMPGAVVTVEDGGTINVNGGLYVLDGLIQADKSGKSYPSYSILKAHGFSQSGMLVVNGNLTVAATGSFAGIAQTTGNTGRINIAEGATLSKTLTMGCAGGYTDDTSVLSLTARVYAGSMHTIAANKTYCAYNNDTFTLPSFAMVSASRMSPISADINQAMIGTFGEYVDDTHIRLYTDISIGEAVADVAVRICGTRYVTDASGILKNVNLLIDTESHFDYSTIDRQTDTYVGTYSQNPVLTQVIKGASLSDGNVYRREYAANGDLVTDFAINAVLNYYGNIQSEDIAVTMSTFNDSLYTDTVTITNAVYPVISFNQALTQSTVAFATYRATVTALATTTTADFLSAAQSAYTDYLAITAGRSMEELAFVATELSSYNTYFDNAKSITVTAATYGDATSVATATLIDGTTANVNVTPVDTSYAYAAGNISASYTYTDTYESIEYTLSTTYSAVAKRAITVSILDTTAVYGDADSDLECALQEGSTLKTGDNLDGIVSVSRATGSNVGNYNITASSDSSFYNVSYAYTQGTTHSVYTITARPITVTIANKTSVYGDTIVALSADVTVGNLIGSDTAYSLATTATATSNVGGDYVISGTKTNNNYDITFVNGAYAITTRAITVTIADKTSVYGDAIVALTAAVTAGNIIGSDTAYSLATTASAASDVAEYEISGTTTNTNYDITFVNGAYTITTRAITVTIVDKTSVYGDAIVALTADVTVGSIVNDDTAYSLATSATVTSAVGGDYAITGTKTDDNYDIIFVNGKYKITTRAITVTIADKTSVYGDAIVALTADVTVGSIANNDTAYSLATTATATSAVGSSYVISGTKTNDNYNITFVNGAYAITTRAITVTIADKTSAYGDAIVALTADVTAGSIVNSDTVYSLATTATATSTVAEYAINGTKTNNNYDIIFVNGAYEITARAIAVVIDAKTITFGDANVELTAQLAAESLGFVGEDTLTTVVSLARAEGNDANTYLISGSYTNTNYDITFTTANYTINQRATNVTVANHSDVMDSKKGTIRFSAVRNYDNEALTDISYQIKKADEIIATAASDGTITVADGKSFDIGEYDVYAVYANANYDITFVKGTLNIVEDNNYYEVSFSFADGATKTYDGEALSFTVEVLVADTQVELVADTDYTVSITKNSTAIVDSIKDYGSYIVSVTITDDNLVYTNNYNVSQRAITVTIADKTSVYGDAIVALTADVTAGNIIGSDTAYSLATTATSTSNVGSDYVISGTKTNTNYDITFVNGAYAITARAITVTIADKTSVYGDAIVALTADVTAGSIVGSDTAYSLATTATATSIVGSDYVISGTKTNTNYDITFVNGAYAITTRAITVTIADKTSVYGEAIAALTADVTVGSIANGDTVYSLATTATATSNVSGDYVISGTKTNTNYDITFVNGAYAVTAREITVTIADKTSVYGDAIVALTADVTAGSIVGSDTAYSLATTATATSAVGGDYAITGTKTDDNYDVTFVNGAYKVTARAITVTIADKTSVYGDAIVALTADVTVGSIANGDTVYSLATTATATSNVGGDYVISGTKTNDNYNITFVNGAYAITTRAITVTIADKTSAYGDAIVALTADVTVGSIVNDDTVYSLATTASAASTVAEYAINGTKTNNNYDVIFVNGTYAVTPREITVTIADKSSVYGDAIVALTATTADTFAGTHTLADVIQLTREAGTAAKTYAITGSSINTNYKVVFANRGVYTIESREISITINDATSIYGNADAPLTYSLTEGSTVGYGDALSAIVSLSRETGSDVAAYAIVGECINTNYEVLFNTDAQYVITARPITVTAYAKTSVYGEAFATLEASITAGQLVEGDETPYDLSWEMNRNKGTYTISITANDANYDVTTVNSTYSVTPASITYRIDDVSSVYGDAEAALTATVTVGSLAYTDTMADLITMTKADGNTVGDYNITAASLNNANYSLTIAYTQDGYSVYAITPRPVTLTVANASCDNTADWATVNSLPTSSITVGNMIADDELDISYSIILEGSNTALTAQNFASEIRGGAHTITATAIGANYEVTVIDGVLTVSKPRISVQNMQSVFTYADGATISVFDWETNLSGYLASANDNTFRATVTADDETVSLNGTVVNAGTYTVTISIVHSSAYIFADNTTTVYTITVEPKDISDSIVPVGFEDGGKVPYVVGLAFAGSVGEYDEKEVATVTALTKGGEAVEAITGIGDYVFTVTVSDDNYCGEAEFDVTIIENVSAKMTALSTKLVAYEALTTSAERYTALLAMRADLLALTADDQMQIAADIDYTSLTEEIGECWTEYVNEVATDAAIAQKASKNVAKKAMEALAALSIAVWFGTKNLNK